MAAKKKTTKKTTAKKTAKKSAPKAKPAPKKVASRPKGKIKWPEVAKRTDVGPLSASDAYQIGQLIHEKFDDSHSLREIGEMEGLRLSPGALHRCLAVYRVCQNLGTEPKWAHLGFSHLNRLDALTAAQQKKVASVAEKQKWSVDRIEREVTKLRQASKKTQRRGRPALPRFAKAIHQLKRFTDGRDDLLGDLGAAAQLEAGRLKELQGHVSQVKTQLDKVDAVLLDALRKA